MHPERPGFIGDFRYALVPNAISPLWGIDLAGGTPGEHLDFSRFSDTDAIQREAIFDQLLGRPAPEGKGVSP